MILESISFANEFTISDLELKIANGYFDEFLQDFSIYVMTNKGIVKINKNTKAIEYNSIIDLSNYVIKDGNKTLSTNDYTNDDKTLVGKINNKSDKGESYTKSESDNKYVVKETNKQLMTKAESDKLATLFNYDDTDIKNDISVLKQQKLNTSDLDGILNSKGYLTEHQNLDAYALKTDVNTKIETIKDDSGYLSTDRVDTLPEPSANYWGKLIRKITYVEDAYNSSIDELYICMRSSNNRDGSSYSWKKVNLT